METKHKGQKTPIGTMAKADTDSISTTANQIDYSRWRTYSSSMCMMQTGKTGKPKKKSDFLSKSFLMHADLKLQTLILSENLISAKYYSQYAELIFKSPYPMRLVEFDRHIDNIYIVEKVFHWIPTQAVFMGRRSCYCSSRVNYPNYKINVETDDMGRINKILVTVFLHREHLCQDINTEINFYHGLKGYFHPNTNILKSFPDLNLDQKVY